MVNIEKTLRQRGNVHGDYTSSSVIKDRLLTICMDCDNWKLLGPAGRESVRMIIEKLGRIMMGDPLFTDHWHDIAGYATLMEKHLENSKGSDQLEIPLNYEEGANG